MHVLLIDLMQNTASNLPGARKFVDQFIEKEKRGDAPCTTPSLYLTCLLFLSVIEYLHNSSQELEKVHRALLEAQVMQQPYARHPKEEFQVDSFYHYF
jgi:hypothetical protein